MKIVKLVLICLVVVFLAIAALFASFRAGLWNPSYDTVKAAYGGKPTQFVDIGGMTIALRDEGQGPVLVMMHSSQTNLREWDKWADLLKQHYRVIRFDWPPYGLSIVPSHEYSMTRAEGVLEQLVDQLKLDKFTLVGTSSGATICVLYAAKHPERIDALALSTLPLAAPPQSHTDFRLTAIGWAHRNFFPDYFPPYFYQVLLDSTFADPAKITPAMVDWYASSNNIPGTQEHIAAYLKADLQGIWKDTGHSQAEQITGPVLLQWGDADPVLPPYLGDQAKALMKNATVTLIHYPDSGHYPMLEIPDKTGADLANFLATIYPPRD